MCRRHPTAASTHQWHRAYVSFAKRIGHERARRAAVHAADALHSAPNARVVEVPPADLAWASVHATMRQLPSSDPFDGLRRRAACARAGDRRPTARQATEQRNSLQNAKAAATRSAARRQADVDSDSSPCSAATARVPGYPSPLRRPAPRERRDRSGGSPPTVVPVETRLALVKRRRSKSEVRGRRRRGRARGTDRMRRTASGRRARDASALSSAGRWRRQGRAQGELSGSAAMQRRYAPRDSCRSATATTTWHLRARKMLA